MEKKNPLLNVGWSLMLVIFVALLLTTFSVLSAISSKSQLDLSERFANAQQDYYKANNKANEILSDIDNELLKEQLKGGDSIGYSHNAYNSLKDKEDISCELENGILKISYSVPCIKGTNEVVVVSLEGCSGNTKSRYNIKKWALVNNSEEIDEYVDEDVHWWGA